MRPDLFVKRVFKAAAILSLTLLVVSLTLTQYGYSRTDTEGQRVHVAKRQVFERYERKTGREISYKFNESVFRIATSKSANSNMIDTNLDNERKLQSLKSMAPLVNKSKSVSTNSSAMRLKRVKDFGFNIFLFSAIVGNSSSKASWDRIVIQGWEDRNLKNQTYVCCVLYKSGALMKFKMLHKLHWAYMNAVPLPVKQYICPNKPRLKQDFPVRATVSATTCHRLQRWYVPTEFAYSHPRQIAVCTKLLYGNLPANDIISWFEVHKMMGVQKVLTYPYELNENATRVLQHYEKQGLVEIVHFNLPPHVRGRPSLEVGKKNAQAWNDEQVPVYDCLERLKGYAYIATIDIDEYIIPNKDKNWFRLFKRLLTRDRNASGFTFLVKLHITSWGPTDNSTQFKIGMYNNRTAAMTDRMKHVTLPDRLLPGGLGTHAFKSREGFHKSYAPQAMATIHHFRACRHEWLNKHSSRCFSLKRYTDYSVAKLFKKVEHNILALKSSLAV